jgi:hypothetical protein
MIVRRNSEEGMKTGVFDEVTLPTVAARNRAFFGTGVSFRAATAGSGHPSKTIVQRMSIWTFSFVVLSEVDPIRSNIRCSVKRRSTMNRNTLRGIAQVLTPALFLSALAAGEGLTPPDREKGLRYLAGSRNGVVEATKGLSEAQWKFKPAPDRWSIAEVVEHLALVENLLLENIRPQLASSTASAPDRDPKQMDATILAKMPDRSTKYQAPPMIVPTGRWTPQVALDRFLASRQQTVAFLKSDADLRGPVVTHPAFGAMDGYEWILAIAAHSERHTKQILEVKADPNYPAK